jgi:5-methylcytosine-specific restriction endonuclease McrA
MHRRKISGGKREAVYVRDGWACQCCGLGFDPAQRFTDKPGSAPWLSAPAPRDFIALEIDHVQPVHHGGSNELSNLRAACAPCNRSKSFKLDQEEVGNG